MDAGELGKVSKMQMPLTLRVVVVLAMLSITPRAYCAGENVMLHYACVESNFRARVPLPIVIDSGEKLSATAIHALARDIPKALQLALAESANAVISSMALNTRQRIEPDAFYDAFVSNVAAQLKQHVDVERCGNGNGDGVEVALYDVGINRYFSKMLGKGEIYQWFVQHGGPYAYAGWVAAVVALDLIGRSADLEVWKQFYEHYAIRFRTSDSQSRAAAIPAKP